MAEGDVAGMSQSLHCRLHAMACRLPAADLLLAVIEGFVAAAVERAVFRDRAAVQRHELEGRARLIAVGDAAVSPLSQTFGRNGLVVGAHRLFVSLRVLIKQERILILLLQLLSKLLIVDLLIIVGVVASEVRHREDLAGIHVHNDTERAVQNIIFLDRRLEVLL